MKVTVCELSDNEDDFIQDWNELAIHLDQNRPDLLLLPELPFSKWIAYEKEVNPESKMKSVEKHETWMMKMERMNVEYIVYSRPVIARDKFFNTAFAYVKGKGHFKIHTKCLFPEEPLFWEETWFDRDEEKFELLELDGIKIGVLLCTEMWFTEHARHYANQEIDILLCPRSTGMSVDRWIRCGQTLSIIAGAFCLSSNRSGYGDQNFQWGGSGWIAEPMSGNLLGITTPYERFITAEIDIAKSREAKKEYPLYVKGY